MNIISWNIRGLGSSVKKRLVSKLIKDGNPDVLFLRETKIESFESSVFQRTWGSSDVIMLVLGLLGFLGEYKQYGIQLVSNQEMSPCLGIFGGLRGHQELKLLDV